ncbi:MAG: tRNA guanosine(34) transglycosylase Tgt [Spirochaetes bacterium]|nr:tRNA guanosine(34) transglycosylase Tgt [Spirochaetota bacterium]
MQFRVIAKDKTTAARTGEIVTARGRIRTPVFMPVATRGAVRALTVRDVDELAFDIILSNTYHLYLRPGVEVLKQAGGLHNFMKFSGPILTDSGGFQVFSLSEFCRVLDDGVEFRSHVDGSLHRFTPESVLDIQRVIGSDIMMVLDQCTDYPVDEKQAREAVERTVRWARDSFRHWQENFDTEAQALFAIVQGSVYGGLRRECCDRLRELPFPGYAVGGLSVGEPKELYREIAGLTLSRLPDDRPRYMMGVGSPMEILHAIRCGTDMFDSVMPTRIARNGTLFTSGGRVNIKSSAVESDSGPLDPGCGCYVCRSFTKSYLRHLYRAGEISALIYNTYHNLYFMNTFMNEIRESIAGGRFAEAYNKWDAVYGNGDI